MIRLQGVRKGFAQRCVLDIEQLDFLPSIRYAVMGANGSGKSTLLRILAKTIQPDSGTVSMADIDEIGYLPQHPYAFSFSAKKNILIAFSDKKDKDARAMEALRAVGIEDRWDQSGNKLSGGEAQRLAVARVLAKKRSVLLLDEPTAAADVNGTDMIEKAVADYHGKTGCMLIVSTHGPAQAMRMADIVLFLEAGKVIEKGESEQVIRFPKTPQVTTFLKHWRI